MSAVLLEQQIQPTCQTQPLHKTKLASQVLVHVMYIADDKAAGHLVS
jgi:hypothetical protein